MVTTIVLVRTVSNIDELINLIPDWEALIGDSAESNINYEPKPLISLLRNMDYTGWFVVCVWENEQLLGFFPLQSVKRLPLPVMQFSTLFKNHLMSCVPLIHKARTKEVFNAFWGWVNEGRIAKIFYVSEMLPSSDVWNVLLDTGRAFSTTINRSLSTTRAIGHVGSGEYDAYVRQTFGAKSRSSMRSKLRKLEKMGGWNLKFITTEGEQLSAELDKLIAVEANSWKREAGTAIALHSDIRVFMHETANYAASNQRFVLAMGYVGDVPAAGMYGLINDGKLLIYKIGFDIKYKKYSVGHHVMMGLVKYALVDGALHTIDSCAAADSEMFKRCLPTRQAVFEYQIASNHVMSKTAILAVTSSRALRIWLKDKLK